jgi:PPM family protein phosphatase
MQFDYACATIKGGRSHQEDSVGVWVGGEPPQVNVPAFGRTGSLCAVLADGMGGHEGGALASTLAARFFFAGLRSVSGDTGARLSVGLATANQAIADTLADGEGAKGMGCTLVGAMFDRDGIQWVSVGDSPMMLIRGGRLLGLNEDQSWKPGLARQVAAKMMSRAAAKHHPRRNELLSALSGEELRLIDRTCQPLELETGDVVLLASDGIDTLSHREIETLCTAQAGKGAHALAEALIKAVEAVADDEQDNTTVVVVRVLG